MNLHRVIANAAVVGFAELRTMYRLRTWLFGWVLRLASQVVFFALIGELAGSRATTDYILLGNVVSVIALESTLVITSAALERYQGTYAMLIASPTGMGQVYLGRGLHWIVAGLGSSSVVLVLVGVIFRPDWAWPATLLVPFCLILVGISSYLYGTVLASGALRYFKYRWLFLNLGYLVLMTFGGVNVPVDFWPAPIEWAAQLLPLTHGLAAVRTLTGGGSLATAGGQALLELLVAVVWGSLSMLSFERLASRGRRDGSLNYTS
ncbi:ABC transporter permease [Kitasatospora purpeofusca]|uniref:ABC transporter permease n=1 Tax=Kitasatospora purpeofusca TaxID=67352 RepID=UPI0035E2F559